MTDNSSLHHFDAMTSDSLNSTKQGMQESSLSAFGLFLQYNRSKLLLQVTSIDAVSIEAPPFTRVDTMHFSQSASSSQSSFNQKRKREIYKCYVQRLLDAVPNHHSMPSRYFREHISHKWELTDESMKSVFRQLAREGRRCNDAIRKNQPSPSKIFHMPDKDSLIHCPIVHNPGRPNKRRKFSSSIDRSLLQGADENERSNLGGYSSTATAEPPVLVKLTGILSFIDNENEIDDGELRRFLSGLDWDRLYEVDER